MRLEDLPLINHLEQIAYDELDRQFTTGQLEPGIVYESAYFDPVSGEIQGIPDLNLVVRAVVEGLWAEEGR